MVKKDEKVAIGEDTVKKNKGERMKEYCGKEELAKIFDIPESTVDYLRRRGEIPAFRVGKHFRFNLLEVEAKLKERSR